MLPQACMTVGGAAATVSRRPIIDFRSSHLDLEEVPLLLREVDESCEVLERELEEREEEEGVGERAIVDVLVALDQRPPNRIFACKQCIDAGRAVLLSVFASGTRSPPRRPSRVPPSACTI